jgi:hypothetical protein
MMTSLFFKGQEEITAIGDPISLLLLNGVMLSGLAAGPVLKSVRSPDRRRPRPPEIT